VRAVLFLRVPVLPDLFLIGCKLWIKRCVGKGNGEAGRSGGGVDVFVFDCVLAEEKEDIHVDHV
jgi:hypothetical protein